MSTRRFSFFVNASEAPSEAAISEALFVEVSDYDANTDAAGGRSRVSFTLPGASELDAGAIRKALNAATASGIAALEEASL